MDYLAMVFLFIITSCCARLDLGNSVGVVVIAVLSLHYSIHHISPEHKALLPTAVHLKQDPALSQVSLMSCYAFAYWSKYTPAVRFISHVTTVKAPDKLTFHCHCVIYWVFFWVVGLWGVVMWATMPPWTAQGHCSFNGRLKLNIIYLFMWRLTRKYV